ncbi:uncharacterized protein LOC124889296 [Capsicum annuum]|uniref:uncharacterized protein LOC124889296 n=1 Tax=Capsicum annuum TaxID=4072 RepID=UPI001FB1829C|nr:uncharacterized protein LOC124889296 [Capsicum annuum]
MALQLVLSVLTIHQLITYPQINHPYLLQILPHSYNVPSSPQLFLQGSSYPPQTQTSYPSSTPNFPNDEKQHQSLSTSFHHDESDSDDSTPVLAGGGSKGTCPNFYHVCRGQRVPSNNPESKGPFSDHYGRHEAGVGGLCTSAVVCDTSLNSQLISRIPIECLPTCLDKPNDVGTIGLSTTSAGNGSYVMDLELCQLRVKQVALLFYGM